MLIITFLYFASTRIHFPLVSGEFAVALTAIWSAAQYAVLRALLLLNFSRFLVFIHVWFTICSHEGTHLLFQILVIVSTFLVRLENHLSVWLLGLLACYIEFVKAFPPWNFGNITSWRILCFLFLYALWL